LIFSSRLLVFFVAAFNFFVATFNFFVATLTSQASLLKDFEPIPLLQYNLRCVLLFNRDRSIFFTVQ